MHKLNQPFVSIITINYNQVNITCDFLKSLKTLSYKNFEVIIVDNNSKKDPTLQLKKAFPDVKIILSEKNQGFAGGNNLGIESASGEYIFIVNNDTIVTKNLIQDLLRPFFYDQSIGVVSPKIRYFDKPNIIQYAGFTLVNPFTGRNKSIGCSEIDKGQHDQPGYTPYAHGAAMMVKRKVFEQVGVLPDIFFLYYEELDWSTQVTRMGFKIYFEPNALIFHKESATIGKRSIIKDYYCTRNRILFMRRNVNSFQFAIFLPYFLSIVVPKTILHYLFTFRGSHLKAFVRAIKWNFSHESVKKTSKAVPQAQAIV